MSSAKLNTADQVWVRKMNRTIILGFFRTHKTLSRARLAAETGLNPSTVSHIISELIQENLVRETDLIQSATGRPGRLLEINPEGGAALGIEINVDYIELLLTDFAANALWRYKQALVPDVGQDVIMAQVLQAAKEAWEFIQAHNCHLLGIGVGVPGLVDVESGLLRLAPNLHWVDVAIKDVLAEHFDCPIYVENEANAGALGEYYFGAVRHVKNFIYLSSGIGLGSGIVMGGKLFRGMFGYAGEAGHMTIDINGEPCGCGKRGCWETFVGPRAVEQRVRLLLSLGAKSSILHNIAKGDLKNIVFDDVVQAAQAGDQIAIDALGEVSFYLGIGIANLVNLFNVEVIVLGGALNRASSLLLKDVERVVTANTLAPGREHLRITPSEHGSDACIMGAIALVLDDVLREPALM